MQDIIIINTPGGCVENAVENEARPYVFRAIRDNICYCGVLCDSLEEYSDILYDSIAYAVLKEYEEGRYQSVTDAFLVMNVSAGLLHKMMNDHKTHIVY